MPFCGTRRRFVLGARGAGLPISHGWEVMDKRAGEGWCWVGYYSAFKQNVTIEIQRASPVTILKEGNGKKLTSPKLRFCFFGTLTKLQLLCLVFLLSQLENTFVGALRKQKFLLKFFIFSDS